MSAERNEKLLFPLSPFEFHTNNIRVIGGEFPRLFAVEMDERAKQPAVFQLYYHIMD